MLIVDCVLGTRLERDSAGDRIEDIIFNVQPLTEPDEILSEACFVGNPTPNGTVELLLASESGEEFALTLKLGSASEEAMLRDYLARSLTVQIRYLDGSELATQYPERFDVPLRFFKTEKDMMVAAMEMRA